MVQEVSIEVLARTLEVVRLIIVRMVMIAENELQTLP